MRIPVLNAKTRLPRLRARFTRPNHLPKPLPYYVLQFTPADAKRINIKSVNEVNYWCHTLNCTETRLRNAVLAVGLLTADVQAYLNR